MYWFIKTENFTKEAYKLQDKERSKYINQHKKWVREMIALGHKISSGYLVNKQRQPGGGGLLVIQAKSFHEAKQILEQDPMIKNGLVTWELNEWIPVYGQLIS